MRLIDVGVNFADRKLHLDNFNDEFKQRGKLLVMIEHISSLNI